MKNLMHFRFFLISLTTCFFILCLLIDINGQDLKPGVAVQIKLPAGFTATNFVEELGQNRHIAVHKNGDVYVHFKEKKNGMGLMRLRDTNRDGKSDTTKGFGHFAGTGIAIKDNYLYASSNGDIFRYTINESGEIANMETPDKIVTGLLNDEQHNSKAFALDDAGNIYVNIGAPSNSCQQTDRMKGSMGMDPCPILQNAAGVWKFKTNAMNQTQQQGERFVTGIRNIVALDWNKNSNQLFAVQHGRDELDRLFPEKFTAQQNADIPAEEMFLLKQGANYGWPYCYYDGIQKKRVTMPEYGGDGSKTDRCAGIEQPILAFPAHWSPNDLLFYTGNMFPEKYRNGAFVAFHGSWNRVPFKQDGYYVAFVPMKDGKINGNYEIFASGFAGGEIDSPEKAAHRACGLAQSLEGDLYISDSKKGKIWKISYIK